jgi:hypothetical protein
MVLSPNEERWVDIPLDRRARAAIVRFRVDGGFRPSERDPASSDRRYLGCWVTFPQ